MKKYNLLVVEDDALIAANLVHTLSSLGFAVLEPVATGQEAVHAVKNQQPDLVLMDIELLGEMDGIETAGRIRAIADIPIVYLTAYTDDQRIQQARLTGPYGYIVKPARIPELNATIGMALYKHDLDRKLKESEEKYRVVADFTYDWEFWIAPGGKFIYVSPSCERITGYRPEEFMADPDLMVTIVHDNDRDRVIDHLSHKEDRFGENSALEFRVITRGGEERWISHGCQPVYSPNGDYLGSRGSNRDITTRKQAEDALRESEERFKKLFVEAPLGIALIDSLTGHIYEVNPMFARIAGRTMEEMVQIDWMSITHPDDVQADLDNMALLNAGKITGFQMEKRYLHHDGAVVWINMTIAPVKVEDTAHPHHLCMIEDITGRKQVEESLRLANKKLNLLSSITRHDINNQLTILMGYLTILQKKQPDPTLNEYFPKVSTAAQRISAMVQFTKEYEEIGVHAPAWQDCCTLVETAIKQAPLGKVIVKNDLPAAGEVFADPLIVKVFYNLMDNAARYGGKITTIRFSVEECDGNQVIVCEDDGDGVPADEKEKIFERGFGKNTGMGLALSREILAITGISIRETGEPGLGARFEMVAPKASYRMKREDTV